MEDEPRQRVPAKSRLSWQIARLCLDEAGSAWVATAFKGQRVAVIVLPERGDESEADWLARVEAAFDANADDPASDDYGGGFLHVFLALGCRFMPLR